MGVLETVLIIVIVIAILGGIFGGPDARVPGFSLAIFLMILLSLLLVIEPAAADIIKLVS